ncbi:MAG: DNA polymerase III subunit delta [Anaerolineae bacterium]|nr:DNA polymerase III subunit delta [Anaerolineae bacterium]
MLPETIKDLPVVTILHGDDDYAIGSAINKITALMGDPSIADLNIARMDGATVSLDDVKSNISTMPFLAERRLVVLTHPLNRGEGYKDKLLGLLNTLPDSAALLLVLDDSFERKDWKTINKSHWLRNWSQAEKTRVLWLTCQLPSGDQMAAWIMNYAKSLQGRFDPHGASELAAHVGSDTRMAAIEVEKLLTYVDYKRPVDADDVNLLTTSISTVSIFDMVDAVAQQNSRKAIHLLHNLLEQQEPAGLFFMIVRQFRLLIQARELLDEGGGADQIERDMRQHPFVAKKLAEQARRFSMPQLEQVYRRLFEMDEAMKTSQAALDLSMDMFIASLAR